MRGQERTRTGAAAAFRSCTTHGSKNWYDEGEEKKR